MVGLRPSDLVEIADTARALARAGNRATLVYLYAGSEIATHGAAFDMLERIAKDAIPGLTAIPLDMLSIHQGLFENDRAIARVIEQLEDKSLAVNTVSEAGVAPGLLPKVWRRVRDPKGTYDVLAGVAPAAVGLARRVPSALWPQAFTAARRGEDATLVYRRFLSFFSRTIAQFEIDAAIIPEDIVGPVWPVLVRAAHDAGIPVVVLPYTLANQSEAIQSLKSQPAFQTANNAIANHLYPAWRFHQGDIDIVRLPSEHILAHEALGITPPDPWMMNSGYADKILVDSRASFDYFLAGGIPAEQMAIAGSVSQDRMFEQRRNYEAALQAVRDELGVGGRKPLLLVSGCPNQLSAPVPHCEFKTIDEVARFVGESVSPLAEHYHLVVRPHPNFPEFGAMLAPFGVTSTMAPTASLVPLADVFVAFASATIRWAIACAIPTINYDVFHYGYGDFASARGVVSVDASREFRHRVRSLTPGSSALGELSARAREDSDYWSLMDGRSVARIEDQIQQARQRRATMSKEQHA